MIVESELEEVPIRTDVNPRVQCSCNTEVYGDMRELNSIGIQEWGSGNSRALRGLELRVGKGNLEWESDDF